MQTREEILFKIKPHLKSIMLAKLNENVRWTYISLPDGKDKYNFIQQIEFFIENKLDDFLKLCQEVLPYFSQDDLAQVILTKNQFKGRHFSDVPA